VIVIEVEPYIDRVGRIPFDRWFENLDGNTQARVTIFLDRLAQGNTSNVKGVGSGVFELRVDFGPGFQSLLRKRRRNLRHPAGRRNKEATTVGHRNSTRPLAGI
jgi:putative addiction module killer protein